ncbi:MAG: amino acid permease [Flavobacteriales bacterium]|nr:amino acid permease [Flavobacteriales bacterium]
MSSKIPSLRTMGTLPVFMTAISTILGAILFLRFGYAVGHVGLIGALAIIIIGHMVTIPTAMAVAEIATNQKVEGGGAYYMISRSFGLNIGATIGITLFLSQAISVAFYIIAFVEALGPLFDWLETMIYVPMWIKDKRLLGSIFMLLLTLLMLSKGANIGVKALYFVVFILAVSLGMFFLGESNAPNGNNFYKTVRNPDSFFYVFTIIFPAFTGIAAGLGLSGDLKDPKKSIPRGTIWATVVGIVIYISVAIKLFYSAPTWDLATDQMVMSDIALWGPIIPIGLGCAAISSALGSIMVAPRTLQALGVDKIFPGKANGWLAKGRSRDGEPFNALLITCIIGFVFIALGDINTVARIISMFFMITYGIICLISFLEQFAADPSYRPTFKSRWYLSLLGAILCFWLMFKMDFTYALASTIIMVLIYVWITNVNKGRKGIQKLFKGVLFQLSRQFQIFIQKRDTELVEQEWRPFIISVSKDSFKRRSAFDLLRWLSHKYGFGTYIHFIDGFLSKETYQESKEVMRRLLTLNEGVKSKVYLDTIISPSYTSAIAQVIQLSGVSGKGNNMILFEFTHDERESLNDAIQHYQLLRATEFDVCILRSTIKGFGYKKNIHIWIRPSDFENANLMILLSYIMLGHPEWKDGVINIFSTYKPKERLQAEAKLLELVQQGRLPISPTNIQLIPQQKEEKIDKIINDKSADADLTIVGYNSEHIEQESEVTFNKYPDLGNILFVSAYREKTIA